MPAAQNALTIPKSARLKAKPTRPRIVCPTVHVFRVVFVSIPKKRETSQKPESLTWLATTEPAASERTIATTWSSEKSGAADDDRLEECGRGRQRHGRRPLGDADDRGDDEAGDDDRQAEGGKRVGDRVADPARARTPPNMPPAPVMRTIEHTGPSAESTTVSTSERLLCWRHPSDHIAVSTVMSRAIGVSPSIRRHRHRSRFRIDPAGFGGEAEPSVEGDEDERKGEEDDDGAQPRRGAEVGELI